MDTVEKRNTIAAKVREIIAEATGNPDIVQHLSDEDDLFSEDTGLDSVDLVSVIVLTERIFETDFSQADFSRLFRNINSITETLMFSKPIHNAS